MEQAVCFLRGDVPVDWNVHDALENKTERGHS